MTEEDKQLLLIDLCARLPYGVICQYDCVHRCDTIVAQRINAQGKLMGAEPTFNGEIGFIIDHTKINAYYDNIRPYLRPMSSMTDEEKEEQSKIVMQSMSSSLDNSESATTMLNDWLLSKHFDVRGLINKGLALEASEEMYKNK